MKKSVFLLIIFSISIGVFSQTTDFQEVCKLHQKNIEGLRATRGAPPSWVDCDEIDEYSIRHFLNDYSQNVAILLYTPLGSKEGISDSLNFMLYIKEGIVFNRSEAINKDQLIDHIALFNSKYSGQAFAARGAIAQSTGKPEADVSYLRQTLLPLEEYLKDIDHLIIVPSLNISTIPFSALPFSDGEYLIDKMSYSIAPSLFEILVINKQIEGLGLAKTNRGSIRFHWDNPLIIENPSYPPEFNNLPGAEKEIASILPYVENGDYTVLKGKEATVQNVLNNIEGRDLLYFATHGIADVKNALDNSFIVLADQGTNSYLTSRTIQNLDLSKTELVILSACQTGLGQEHEGGIIGLTRAFQIAGAKNILSTLWSIDDNKTPELMRLFFEEMQRGGELMPYEAWRQAVLRFKKEVDADPRYWAAFMFFGVPY